MKISSRDWVWICISRTGQEDKSDKSPGAISVRLLFIEFFLLYTVRLRKTYFVTKNIYISLLIVLLTEWIAGLKYFGQKCTASGLAVSKLT